MAAGMGPKMGKDMLKEQWLRYFVDEEEHRQILQWLQVEGLCRPRGFDARLEHAAYLKELGNDWFKRSDFRRALHCALGAIHALDFMPAEQLEFSEEQRQETAEAMLPVISNLAMILLKRGDFENAERAATVGLRCAHKLPKERTTAFRVKLLYRRGLARGEPGPTLDLSAAREDLAEAARLEPTNREVRACLENCKQLLRKKGGEGAEKAEAEGDSASAEGQASAQEPIDEDSGAVDDSGPSPRALWFAEVLGRCLGRSRRRCRRAMLCAQRLRAATTLRVMVVVLLGPLVGIGVAASMARSSGASTSQKAAPD